MSFRWMDLVPLISLVSFIIGVATALIRQWYKVDLNRKSLEELKNDYDKKFEDLAGRIEIIQRNLQDNLKEILFKIGRIEGILEKMNGKNMK